MSEHTSRKRSSDDGKHINEDLAQTKTSKVTVEDESGATFTLPFPVGQSKCRNVISPARSRKEELGQEGEEEEDEMEEDALEEEVESTEDKKGGRGGVTGRGVTLQMLLGEGILQPGDGAMTIDYLGQKFTGDLLGNGKIKSQETNEIFGSPSAWAIYCKKIVNPDKKSGCGWASVKYRGLKLDSYKTMWFRRKRQNLDKENEAAAEGSEEDEGDKDNQTQVKREAPLRRIVVKHQFLGNRSATHDLSTLVETSPFSSQGKIQPFTVSLSTAAALTVELHCHLTTSEVVGYLGGHWDVNAHNLAITHAFPCLCRLNDSGGSSLVEKEIIRKMERKGLLLVGWYHSHPFSAATPSLRDIDAQLEYEIKMKGGNDASYTPCIGLICSPYDSEFKTVCSSLCCYWVMPPPENRPQEYGRPMLMTYREIKDRSLYHGLADEMRTCISFYKKVADYHNFTATYAEKITYYEKIKTSMEFHHQTEVQRDPIASVLNDLLLNSENKDSEMKEVVITPQEKDNKKQTKEIMRESTSSEKRIPVPLIVPKVKRIAQSSHGVGGTSY